MMRYLHGCAYWKWAIVHCVISVHPMSLHHCQALGRSWEAEHIANEARFWTCDRQPPASEAEDGGRG